MSTGNTMERRRRAEEMARTLPLGVDTVESLLTVARDDEAVVSAAVDAGLLSGTEQAMFDAAFVLAQAKRR